MTTTVTSIYPSSNRSIPSTATAVSNPIDPRRDQAFFTANTHSNGPRISRSVDDSAILSMQRQYDLSELETIHQLVNLVDPDSEEDDLAYDDGGEYDYPIAIQERLRRANADLEHDQTSSELRHPPRVSFDTIVKAVDIVRDPNEDDSITSPVSSRITPVPEESSDAATVGNSSRSENDAHEYTVPLNDIQPREGPSLTEQLKAAQFYGIPPTNDRWATTAQPVQHGQLPNQDDLSTSSFKSNENHFDSQNTFDFSGTTSLSKKSMIVAVNDRIELQDEDDYIAKHTSFTSNTNGNDSFDTTNKPLFIPTPPTEPKPQQQCVRGPFIVRPKSSTKRKPQLGAAKDQRPTSAGVTKSLERHVERPSSGVDFRALSRKYEAEKRAKQKLELEQQKEAEEKRLKKLAIAQECYDGWLRDKKDVLKRIKEEKLLKEKEEEERKAKEKEELEKLRKAKYQEWLDRKRGEAVFFKEFQQLKASEEYDTLGDPATWLQRDRMENEQAYQKWLQRKRAEAILVEQFRQIKADEEFKTLGDPATWLHENHRKNERAFRKWLRKKRQQSVAEKNQMNTNPTRVRRRQHHRRTRHQCEDHEVRRPCEDA